MLGRTIIATLASLLACLPAAADPASMCNGRYAEAANIVDKTYSRYETLYSGGVHQHTRDTVIGTLNVYRVLKGYTPFTLKNPAWLYYEDSTEKDRKLNDRLHNPDEAPDWLWNEIEWAVRPASPAGRKDADLYWAGFGWDIMTWGTQPADHWMRPDAADGETVARAWMLRQMKKDPAYEWMQMVLAASNAPWANTWVIYANYDDGRHAVYQRLTDAALRRYEAGQGVEWLVAAAINSPDPRGAPILWASLQKLQASVRACSATPAEYAALASSLLAIERAAPDPAKGDAWLDLAPPGIRTIALEFASRRAMGRLVADRQVDRASVDHLLGLDPQGKSQATGLLGLYTARTAAEIPVVQMPKTWRAYNALSADTLAEMGRRGSGEGRILGAAFARHVAMGNTAKAAALLPDLKRVMPAQAATIDRVWSGKQPQSVRLALIVLEIPSISALVGYSSETAWDGDGGLEANAAFYDGHKNLPRQYGKLDYLQRDYEAELHLPQGLRWLSLSWTERLRRRDLFAYSDERQPGLVQRGKAGLPFDHLIARDELKRLAGNQNLMITVSNRIVAWAGQANPKGPDRELVAEALADTIRLCKFNICGGTKSHPAAERAFQILKKRYRGTRGFRHTRWWYLTSPNYD